MVEEYHDVVNEHNEEGDSWIRKIVFNFNEKVAIWVFIIFILALIYFKSYAFEDKYYYYIIFGALGIIIISSLKENRSDMFISEYDGRCIIISEILKRKKHLIDRNGFRMPSGEFYVDMTSTVQYDTYTNERTYRVYDVFMMKDAIPIKYHAKVYKNGDFDGIYLGIAVESPQIKMIIPAEYRMAKAYERGKFN